MRHLWSLLAGLTIAPLTWVLLAYANGGIHVTADAIGTNPPVIATALVAIAGLIVGSIASLRVSPLGPLFSGLLLISVSVLGLAIPGEFYRSLPDLPEISDLRSATLSVPVGNGELLLVGAILVFAVFSAQRWRMWPTSKLHPTVGPVNPMIDTGRIEAIKSWSPGEDTGSTPTAATPTVATPVYLADDPTNPIVAGKHASTDKTETDGASPWAAPPTGR
ncbi:hypothetical protein F4553_003662 [Allocatelliglobosispora scoriae]|uniref:Uncharacterized protein n=1 Tax=Allocatelliglobosispora scoriae TaxID=643052 RepID=A0A841BTN9_9ACTN|nr:hypothetical protein [Allocatelliglobosispora scoriae]MBB5870283.1 hypothetical protein [Allocatelliglobosispora scoriae]